MCIIAIKKRGVNLPSLDTLKTMFVNNPDGASISYNYNNQVYYVKGLINFEDFKEELTKIDKKIDILKSTMIFHFRITTHGSTSKENTHPFKISNNFKEMQKIKGNSDLLIFHNGTISIETENTQISDTMQYIKSVVYPLYKLDKNFYKNKDIQNLLKVTCKSKLAFLDKNGDFITIGDFIEDEEMIYSNNSYKTLYYAYDDCNFNFNYLEKLYPLSKTDKILFENDETDNGLGYYINKFGDIFYYSYFYDKALYCYAFLENEYTYDDNLATDFEIDYYMEIYNKNDLIHGLQ